MTELALDYVEFSVDQVAGPVTRVAVNPFASPSQRDADERKRRLEEAREEHSIREHGFVKMKPARDARGWAELQFDWEKPKWFRGRLRWKHRLYNITQREWQLGIIDDDAFKRSLKALGYDPYG